VISLLVPTRGRPANVKRFLDSAAETAGGEWEAVFYVDADDPTLTETCEAITGRQNTCVVVGERIVLSAMWNKCADRAWGDILGHMGDDIVFSSPDWVPMVEAQFDSSDDKILFVHGRDGCHDARFGTHGFVHRKWMETLDYFVPPLFSSDWNDQWLNDLANALDRRVFLPGLYTRHMHYVFGLADRDATYAEREQRGAQDNVMQLYRDTAHLREQDIAKLRAVIDGSA
jgi:hypothetical protein